VACDKATCKNYLYQLNLLLKPKEKIYKTDQMLANHGHIVVWLLQYMCDLDPTENKLTHSLPVFVEVAEMLAQTFLVLHCYFSVSSSNATYYGYTTEIVPVCISKTLVMF
jgi:hypothetical protein